MVQYFQVFKNIPPYIFTHQKSRTPNTAMPQRIKGNVYEWYIRLTWKHFCTIFCSTVLYIYFMYSLLHFRIRSYMKTLVIEP